MANRTCSIDDCAVDHRLRRGMCVKHYRRWQKYGDPRMTAYCPRDATLDQRLRFTGWTEVMRRPELGPCWEWSGSLTPNGYGQVSPVDGVRHNAHRLAYLAWVGPLEDEQHACHRCDNPPCINPAHLFPGTGADNSADMVSKRRSYNGERHHDRKLTDADVVAIRDAYATGGTTQRALAADYGVSQGHISVLVRGLIRARTTNPPIAS